MVDITKSNKIFHSGNPFTLSVLLHLALIYNDSGNLQATTVSQVNPDVQDITVFLPFAFLTIIVGGKEK